MKAAKSTAPELWAIEAEHDRFAGAVDGRVVFSGSEEACRKRLAILGQPDYGPERRDQFLRRAVGCAVVFLCLIGTAWGDGLPILPDDVLTPGVIASTDETEVCAVGPNGTYSQQHRQTSAAMKRAVFERYGIDKATAGEVEVDHRGPLCAGFADDIRNLWIQPGNGHGTHWTFHLKDAVEALACRQICSGKVSLSEAQSWFLAPADWRTAYCRAFSDPACDSLAADRP